MSISAPAHARIERSLSRLRRRDDRLLLGFGLASLVLVVLAEWGALQWSMAEQYGSGVILLRAVVYVMLALLLWRTILAGNRRQVAGLMQRTEENFEAILRAYDGALALKDPYTGGHGRRVAAYAAAIARGMGLAEEGIERIYQAGLLHDIGKLGVADMVLNKPGKLDVEEYRQIRQHPQMGAEIVARIPSLQALVPAIRHHHERFNGSGYPGRLSGDAIPQEARIIAVADALDAMSSERSYRPAMPWEMAMAELQRSAGACFDPQVVNAALSEPCRSQLQRLRFPGGKGDE